MLLDTTQLYYYFFHKTPHMMLRRVLMVLAASLEFERGHNSEVEETFHYTLLRFLGNAIKSQNCEIK